MGLYMAAIEHYEAKEITKKFLYF
jgi:hypothetical protein